MIELALTGAYLGTPHEIGAWAYVIRRGEELLGTRTGIDRPQAVTSRLAAEAAALALGLEELTQAWEGEEVVVQTTSVGLEGLLLRRGRGVARDISCWYSRVRQAAATCASVRVLLASPDDLASLRRSVEELLPRARIPGPIARASDFSAPKEERL